MIPIVSKLHYLENVYIKKGVCIQFSLVVTPYFSRVFLELILYSDVREFVFQWFARETEAEGKMAWFEIVVENSVFHWLVKEALLAL